MGIRPGWMRWLAIILAILAAVVRIPPELVERWFTAGLYVPLQRALTTTSNALPLPWMDPLLVAALVTLAIVWWRASRRPGARIPRLADAAVSTAALVAVVYLAFLALWGLNYRRVPLSQHLVIDRRAPSTEDVAKLGLEAAARLNALYAPAHARGWEEPLWQHAALRDSAARVQRILGRAEPAVPGRLKRSVLGQLFRWNGTDAMTNPFGLEVLANPDLLPFERPFVASHEWAHLAGFADESEANFVGWLTCVGADVPAQYSGWLSLYWQIDGTLPRAERLQLAAVLDRGPRADMNAIADRLRRAELPLLRTVSWLAYDRYLKANRVEAGVRSYGLFVTLILTARFEDGWRPVVKPPAPRAL